MTPVAVTWFDADASEKGKTRSGMLIDTIAVDGRTHGVVIEGGRFSTPRLYALRVKENV